MPAVNHNKIKMTSLNDDWTEHAECNFSAWKRLLQNFLRRKVFHKAGNTCVIRIIRNGRS